MMIMYFWLVFCPNKVILNISQKRLINLHDNLWGAVLVNHHLLCKASSMFRLRFVKIVLCNKS